MRILLLILLAGALSASPLLAQADTNSAPNDVAAPAPSVPPPSNFAPNPPVAAPATGTPGQPSQDEIADIRPPLFFLYSWKWLWYALGAIAVLAALAALWTWLKPKRFISPKTAYDLALEKLEQAKALLHEDKAVPYSIAVSETIRTYLGQRFQASSSRQTTEEFLRQMESDGTTPLAEHRDLLRDFLTSCDLVKFAKYRPHVEELEAVHQRAYTFVTATKPLPSTDPRNGARP